MNVRKHLLFASVLLSALCLPLSSCSDDNSWPDVDGAAPIVSLNGVEVHIEPGMNISIKGTLTDADGITSVHLYSPGLYLDKTIDLVAIYGKPQTEYTLDYNVQSERHEEGEEFVITITVTDAGGRQTMQKFNATLDGDFTAPFFTIKPDENLTVLIKEKTLLKLNFEVEDNRTIDYATIDLKKIVDGNETSMPGYPQTLKGDGKTLVFQEAIEVPSESATYKAYISAFDADYGDGAHEVTAVSTITVQELPDFDVMYLADVNTEADLNADVFGVPVAMDHIGEYQYRVRYYNVNAGTQICFIPQKGSFGPICFAPSKDNASELGDELDQENKIVLDKANTYYLFEINTLKRSYSVSSYPVSDAISPVSHMVYGGDYLWTWSDNWVGGDWMQEFYFGPATGPGNVIKMEQDSKNPNLYTLEWNVTSSTFFEEDHPERFRFVIHNWHSHGWWNYASWRVDDSGDPSKCQWYGLVYPDNQHFIGNADFFQWKYGNLTEAQYKFMYPDAEYPFSNSSWDGSEDYRKKFVPDNWVSVSPRPANGTYIFTFDVHAERIKMVRK